MSPISPFKNPKKQPRSVALDAPAKADDDAHVAERGPHGFRAGFAALIGITSKDLEEEEGEGPAGQAGNEVSSGNQETSLASIAVTKSQNNSLKHLPVLQLLWTTHARDHRIKLI